MFDLVKVMKEILSVLEEIREVMKLQVPGNVKTNGGAKK